MSSPYLKLRRLTDDWHDGTISPENVLQLERCLLNDPAARQYFFSISELEAALPAAASHMSAPAASRSRSAFPWWRMAAVFVIGCVVGSLVRKGGTPNAVIATSRSPGDATVTGMLGISRDDASGLHALPPGKETQIQSGLVELTFASGVRAVIEGPASFQIAGGNSMRFTHGKIVADVPKGAEGFTVTYAEGQIVDLGTEFGLEIPQGGGKANFGVFRGEIEYRPDGDASRMVRLLENHAVLTEGETITSVPFDSSKFTRRMPSREFAWKLTGESTAPAIWDYDVSHLIWKPGEYRTIVKWMVGPVALKILKSELLLDGKVVIMDEHVGSTRWTDFNINSNSYTLPVAADQYRRGTWTLRVHALPQAILAKDQCSEGVILFEEGLAVNATPADFIGTWEYLHNGIVYRRAFHPDGTASLTMDGKPYEMFKESSWEVREGRLILSVLNPSGQRGLEEHVLRDSNTLIFTNFPYRNARRIAEP